MDSLQDNRFEGSETFESDITSNDLLLENILSHVGFEDLLPGSLVNKSWLHSSRRELRKRKCLAKVDGSKLPPCQQLQELSRILESISEDEIPFTGLRIDGDFHLGQAQNDSWPICSPAQTFSAALNRIPLKYFRVYLSLCSSCSTTEFIKRLFTTRGREIAHLCIGGTMQSKLSQGLTKFLGISDPSHWLSNLRVLEINSEMKEGNLAEILNVAPNLEEIWGQVDLRHFPLLMSAKKVKLVQEFQFDPFPTIDNLMVCLEFARSNPKPKSVYVSSIMMTEQWESEKWLDILAPLMQSCAATLRELEIEHLDLLLIAALAGLPPFCHLRKLSVSYNSKLDRHLGCLSLRWIDFPSLFPSLKSVSVHSKHLISDNVDTDLERLNGLLGMLMIRAFHKCRSVRSLELIGVSISRAWSDPLADTPNLFPAVSSISFRRTRYLRPNLSFALASKWPLEKLSFEGLQQQGQKALKALNALLCGISPEESNYLSTTIDAVSLQEYNLVPIEHSLLNFENLRTLKIHSTRYLEVCSCTKLASSSRIASVTSGLILSRMPGLEIDFIEKCWNCTTYRAR